MKKIKKVRKMGKKHNVIDGVQCIGIKWVFITDLLEDIGIHGEPLDPGIPLALLGISSPP